MNIWLIQIGELLPLNDNVKKMRTAMLAEKLIEKRHSVTWWTSAFDHFKKKRIFMTDTALTIKEGLKILVLRGLGYKRNISFSRFIDHRIITSKFRKLAKEIKRPDIIITSTPPYDLAYQAVGFGRSNDIPTIVDVRDPWPDILGGADAGIVCLHPMVNYLLGLPVKMFEYMAVGLPVIASNFPLWKKIVEENNCGICVSPLNPEEIAKAIEYLIEYPEEAKKMGENGRKAVLEKYNWENESKKLLKIYEKLFKNEK